MQWTGDWHTKTWSRRSFTTLRATNEWLMMLLMIYWWFDWCYWWFNKTFLYCKAKNYQFLIQAEIWSYHWSKEYCKLLPLLVYYFGPDGILQHDLLCFSSDDNNHYTSFFHQVQTMLVYYLKANHPNIIKN